jgi:hypothetical protein
MADSRLGGNKRLARFKENQLKKSSDETSLEQMYTFPHFSFNNPAEIKKNNNWLAKKPIINEITNKLNHIEYETQSVTVDFLDDDDHQQQQDTVISTTPGDVLSFKANTTYLLNSMSTAANM